MIKIKVIAVGKVKEEYFSGAISEYKKRLQRYCDVEIVEVKEENFVKEPSEKQRCEIMKLEGENILRELKGVPICLAIEGKQYSSVEFSKLISEYKNSGEELSFIIGGSYGIDEGVKAKCKNKISFSKMTFPHTLARVVLLEQLYRAFTIINDGKYHK